MTRDDVRFLEMVASNCDLPKVQRESLMRIALKEKMNLRVQATPSSTVKRLRGFVSDVHVKNAVSALEKQEYLVNHIIRNEWEMNGSSATECFGMILDLYMDEVKEAGGCEQ